MVVIKENQNLKITPIKISYNIFIYKHLVLLTLKNVRKKMYSYNHMKMKKKKNSKMLTCIPVHKKH